MTLLHRHSIHLLLSLIAPMLSCIIFTGLIASRANAEIDWGSLSLTQIKTMQAVNSDGSAAWSPGTAEGYKFRGVVLNDPAEILDTTPAEGYEYDGPMGGQWQVFVQTVLNGDCGGMALWMGQNYGNLTWINDAGRSYSDTQWTAELDRLNYPKYLGTEVQVTSPLQPGDIIEVHARTGKAYKGKYNCNENHQNDSAFDFDIYVIARDQTLPITDILLDGIKNADDSCIFDHTRQSGGEFYQGQRVRLRNVTIDNPTQWGQINPATDEYYNITVSDGSRSLEIVLGQNDSFQGTMAPEGILDIIGIFDQESTDSVYSTDGYRMWALTPDAFTMVPEPGALLLLVSGGLLLFVVWRRR